MILIGMLFLLGMNRLFESRQRSTSNEIKKNPENKLWALTHKQQGINLAPSSCQLFVELGRAYAAAGPERLHYRDFQISDAIRSRTKRVARTAVQGREAAGCLISEATGKECSLSYPHSESASMAPKFGNP